MASVSQAEAQLLSQKVGLVGWWHFLRRYPVVPIAVLSVLVVVGVFAPLLAQFYPAIGNIRDRQLTPFSRGHVSPSDAAEGEVGRFHILGTDHVGRYPPTRVMYGARISLMVAGIALVSGFIIGTAIGLLAGYIGGIWDEIITRMVDIWYALPFLMVALVMTLLYGQSLQLLLGLLAALSWAGFVRVIRARP